jgi:hypothetical protein
MINSKPLKTRGIGVSVPVIAGFDVNNCWPWETPLAFNGLNLP